MKMLLFFCLLVGTVGIAAAQPAMNHGNWETNTSARSRAHQAEPNEFESTEMTVGERCITFSNLPEVKKAAWVVVTDASGELVTQRKISPADNTIGLRSLTRGELYFVHIMYKDQSRKGFVLHL